MERRLTAILAADVVGYSRLMGANEVGTLQSLQKHQAELIEPEIAGHAGRIVKLTGDGILVEFGSVVNAVECATAIQKAMPARNADVPEDRRIEFRIGINLGDVIVEGDDIFGHGVNVAARLEGIARPGGVAVSQSVKDHVGNRQDVMFEDRGNQPLKNIEEPVRVFDVQLGTSPLKGASAPRNGQKDRPSIAVLPFANMSGDSEQDYFSDGITEDIITDLSKVSGLFVIGRTTSFAYRGKSVDLTCAATEMGVRFILEGSVRKVGNRIRITGQLIDGITGGHVWADRYDRDLTDIFVIQDEITKTIVDQLKVQLLPDDRPDAGRAPTDNVEAYKHFLRGREAYYRITRAGLRMARQLFARAAELDPNFARAHAGIASCDAYLNAFFSGTVPVGQIIAIADRALTLDPKLAEAHAARGQALNLAGRGEEAELAFARALALDADSFEANLAYAKSCVVKGRLELAAEHFKRALEIRTDDYLSPLILGQVLRSLGRNDDAEQYERLGLDRAAKALERNPEEARPAHMGACAWASLGEAERAKSWMARAIAIDPDDSMLRYNAACLAAQLGDLDEALDRFEDWLPNAGPENKAWIEQDPDFDSLRDHPRFKRLMETIDANIAGRVAS